LNGTEYGNAKGPLSLEGAESSDADLDVWSLFRLRNYYDKMLTEGRLAWVKDPDVKKSIQDDISGMHDIPDDDEVKQSEPEILHCRKHNGTKIG
jgi:hypothetical protein